MIFFFFDNLIIGCVGLDIYIENTKRCQPVELQVTTLLAMWILSDTIFMYILIMTNNVNDYEINFDFYVITLHLLLIVKTLGAEFHF